MGTDSDGCQGNLACKGEHGSVVFAELPDGTWPARLPWNEQSQKWQASFLSLFLKITSTPTLQLRNREQFKVVEGRLFEFKHNGHKSRIFAFREGRAWYLVHVFTHKKEDKLPDREVQIATRRMNDALSVLESRRREPRK